MAGEVIWDAEPDTPAAISDGKPDRPRKMTFVSQAAQIASGGGSEERNLLRGSAMIVAVSLALLWLLGGVVFRNARIG